MMAIRLSPGSDDKAPKVSDQFARRIARDEPQPARILVVEDEWLIATEIEYALETAGYEIVGLAMSADEAVRLAEQHRPDLIIMDIRLHGSRDGVDAALEIWQRLRLRSMFASAHIDPQMRERASPANPAGWLGKPFSSGQLLQALELALQALKG